MGTFIEAQAQLHRLMRSSRNFPTFGWGLSLRRQEEDNLSVCVRDGFPHLRVGTFIEAPTAALDEEFEELFPHLRVGTFIEAFSARVEAWDTLISPPSGGDFH